MSTKFKKILLTVVAAGFIFSSAASFAENFPPAIDNAEPCPVNPAYPDNDSLFDGGLLTGVPADQVIDAEFGPGAQANTQCMKERKKFKIVVRLNDAYRSDAFGNARLNAAMFLSNIDKFFNQYENTHGMSFTENVDVRVIMGGSGAALATTKHKIFAGAAMRFNAEVDAGKQPPGTVKLPVNQINPYIAKIQEAMGKGIKFYLCQEASRTLKISNMNKIPGIHYIPAAHAATADLQLDGYAILIP